MNAIVPGQAQHLQPLIVGHAQVIADDLADGLALVVLQHGEETAQNACRDQQSSRRDECLGCKITIDVGSEQSLGLVDRAAKKLGNEELKDTCAQCGNDTQRHAPAVAQGHRRYSAENPGVDLRDIDVVSTVEFEINAAPRFGPGRGHAPVVKVNREQGRTGTSGEFLRTG